MLAHKPIDRHAFSPPFLYETNQASASLVARALAQLIDLALFGAVFYGLWMIPQWFGWENVASFESFFKALVLSQQTKPIEIIPGLMFLTTGGIWFFCYFVALPFHLRATTGMRMLGLRYVSRRGDGRPSAIQLFVREVVKWGVVVALTKGILLIVPLFREDGRGFPDFLSQTVVKRARRI